MVRCDFKDMDAFLNLIKENIFNGNENWSYVLLLPSSLKKRIIIMPCDKTSVSFFRDKHGCRFVKMKYGKNTINLPIESYFSQIYDDFNNNEKKMKSYKLMALDEQKVHEFALRDHHLNGRLLFVYKDII